MRQALALVPNAFGGLDVVDVWQLVLELADDDADVEAAYETARIDSTLGFGYKPDEIERLCERIARFNRDDDIHSYWHIGEQTEREG